MNFTWTTLQVSDMEVSLHFYQEIIGLPLKRRFSPDGVMNLAFLGNEGESEIELICEPSNKKVTTQGISIGFMSKQTIEETIKILENHGYQVVSPIISPNPNLRFIHVNNPDGYIVQLIQDMRK
ncbi:MAG: VOC family protein [Clostridia bacterium]|nr:VOC family protein [Clostridia bacterium]